MATFRSGDSVWIGAGIGVYGFALMSDMRVEFADACSDARSRDVSKCCLQFSFVLYFLWVAMTLEHLSKFFSPSPVDFRFGIVLLYFEFRRIKFYYYIYYFSFCQAACH